VTLCYDHRPRTAVARCRGEEQEARLGPASSAVASVAPWMSSTLGKSVVDGELEASRRITDAPVA
jgi:hypothetical protein